MKKIILLISVLALALGLFAVEVTIGDGTDFNGSSVSPSPYSGWYKNERDQYLITVGELNAAGGGAGDITSIAFNVEALNSVGARHLTIKMGHTSLSELTTNFITGLTTVFEADPYTPTLAWNTHTLDSTFNWNGTDNLVIEVYYGDLAQNYTSNASVYYTTTSTYKALYQRSDDEDVSIATIGIRSNNRPNMQFNMAELQITDPPSPAIAVSPLDEATDVSLDADLNWAAGTGLPTGYTLYFGTTESPTQIGDLGDVTTYDPGTLSYNTTYYWQVVPYNTYGDAVDCPIWSFTTIPDPTITAADLPYLENFDGVTAPDFPMGWDTITNTANTYAAFGTYTYSTPYSTPNHVRMYNSGDAEAKFTLITPPIDIDLASLRVRFYAMYSNGGYLDVGVWDGSTFSSVETVTLNTSYTEHTVNLDAYLGTGDKIAFCGYFDGTYEYIYLDDVTIEEIPTAPIISVSPDTWDFGTKLINTITPKEFTISNVGAGTLTVSSINVTGTGFALAEAFTPVSLLANESDTFTVNFAPTTEGTYSGYVAINDNRATTNIALSAEALDPTIYAENMPHIENFDGDWTGSPAAPLGWTVINANNDIYYWSQDNTYISPTHSGNYAAHGMGNTNDYLITPPIDLTGVDVRISWWDVVESASYANSYKVLLSTTDTQIFSFTEELGDFTCTNTTWTEHIINLDDYNGQTVYIAFYQYSSASTYFGFGIDDVLIEEMPSTPIFSITPDVDTWDFGALQINTTASKTFTIQNTGGADLVISDGGISIVGTDADQFGLGEITYPMTVTPGGNASFTVSFTPTTVGSKSATLQIVDNIGTKALHTVALTGQGVILNTVPYAEAFADGWGDWIVVNGEETNKWFVGDPDAPATKGQFGSNAAFISNDEGTTWAYTVNATSVVHFYQDFAFPAENSDFKLKFDWLCNGETGYDYLRVFAIDTSETPTAGIQLTGALGTYIMQSTVQHTTLDLPDAFAGTTQRIVFTWKNDSSVGNQPPAVVDNIRLVIGEANDTGEVENGVVNLDTEVTPDGGSSINPNVEISNISGDGTVNLIAGYGESDLPNAGLNLTLSGT
ncbi:MAG: large repetitive protein, partial [Candidatus Cloacimonadota bacterium]|nr:large repetitive protein [Candidatus Cloacimonadota bacterium]